jgi:acetaldehyde dehydrogenase (acetylating)
MADQPSPTTDRDLASMAEARQLARKARVAQLQLDEFTQEQVDAVVDAMVAALRPHVEGLARAAHEETGFGNVADKIRKNRFAIEQVYESIRPLRTVGVIGRDEARKVVEIAEPFGVVAGIIPSTNPTSTAIYKVLLAIKARCAIVLSPHPAAVGCITRTAEIMEGAARTAGLPDGGIRCMQTVTLEGTQELMRQREVAVILATGGMGLVRAAYSAGKPAYGVGPGNAPAYIERTADLRKAVRDIVTGKTFDYGVLCSAENSVVVDAEIADAARAEFVRQGACFLDTDQAARLAAVLVTPQRLPNPDLVGRSAEAIAARVGLTVPAGTRVLIAELTGVGRDHPLSMEKLCPVLSFYVVRDWREGCERCKQILEYGGMGHTMSIHSSSDEVILQFGHHKPASRIVVNTPSTLGSIGLTTGLDPAMTLGCGGFGGNITSDNIAPRHLLNVKRLAFEIRPVQWLPETAEPAGAVTGVPAAPASGQPTLADSSSLSRKVDEFLARKGLAGAASPPGLPPSPAPPPPAPAPDAPAQVPSPVALDFVCEDDVRDASRAGRRIRLAARAIVTPSARDLGESLGIFD